MNMNAFPKARRRWGRATLAVLVLAVTLSCDPAAGMRGVVIDPPREVPAFTFQRADGTPFSTAAEQGRPMVLFFGYTHCPDVCPTTLADWKRAKAQLGEDGDRVRWVFVTVDPERDTPEIAQRYATQFDSAFVGVSGDSATTAALLQAFGVAAIREAPGAAANEYLVSHSSQTFLVDPRGRLIAMYSFGSGWDALANDLDRVL